MFDFFNKNGFDINNLQAEDLQHYYKDDNIPVIIDCWKKYYGGKNYSYLLNNIKTKGSVKSEEEVTNIFEENEQLKNQIKVLQEQLNNKEELLDELILERIKEDPVKMMKVLNKYNLICINSYESFNECNLTENDNNIENNSNEDDNSIENDSIEEDDNIEENTIKNNIKEENKSFQFNDFSDIDNIIINNKKTNEYSFKDYLTESEENDKSNIKSNKLSILKENDSNFMFFTGDCSLREYYDNLKPMLIEQNKTKFLKAFEEEVNKFYKLNSESINEAIDFLKCKDYNIIAKKYHKIKKNVTSDIDCMQLTSPILYILFGFRILNRKGKKKRIFENLILKYNITAIDFPNNFIIA